MSLPSMRQALESYIQTGEGSLTDIVEGHRYPPKHSFEDSSVLSRGHCKVPCTTLSKMHLLCLRHTTRGTIGLRTRSVNPCSTRELSMQVPTSQCGGRNSKN